MLWAKFFNRNGEKKEKKKIFGEKVGEAAWDQHSHHKTRTSKIKIL